MQVLADGALIDKGDGAGGQGLLRLGALGDVAELLRVVLREDSQWAHTIPHARIPPRICSLSLPLHLSLYLGL